jgi:hypothetical protein
MPNASLRGVGRRRSGPSLSTCPGSRTCRVLTDRRYCVQRFGRRRSTDRKKSLAEVDFDRVWEAHRTVPYNKPDDRPKFDQPGCVHC